MRVGIIGAGFTGLAASLRLAQKGHKVWVFEKEEKPGGLAIGFRDPSWNWPLESHYHHLFTSDWAIRNLAEEVGHPILFRRPKTSVFLNGEIFQLDSPFSLLQLPYLPLLDKLRTATTLGYLRLTPWWKPLEGTTASSFLRKTMGENAWKLLWQPLFDAKFGKYAKGIPASWFWARVKKRSASLGYPKGGFESLAQRIQKAAESKGAKFVFGTAVDLKKLGDFGFDKVISTLPSPTGLAGLGAVNLVLALKRQFLADGTYWLNINERGFPFLAVVEHANFISKKHYGGDRIVYVGNYMEKTHPYFGKTEKELLKEFTPFLQKINPKFSTGWVRKSWVFKAPFAQPIIPLHYSKHLPPFETPTPNLYRANIQQVYPWDRGTNYAVELGEKVAKLVSQTK